MILFLYASKQHIFYLCQGGNSKEVWLDYVLVIAETDFKGSVLKEANMIDYTREFIEKCAMNHYYIANTTGEN